MNQVDAKEKIFMLKLVDSFKAFVSDSIDEGYHNDFPDHLEFMAACLETFIDKESEI